MPPFTTTPPVNVPVRVPGAVGVPEQVAVPPVAAAPAAVTGPAARTPPMTVLVNIRQDKLRRNVLMAQIPPLFAPGTSPNGRQTLTECGNRHITRCRRPVTEVRCRRMDNGRHRQQSRGHGYPHPV